MDSANKLNYLREFSGRFAGTDEAGRGPLAGPVMGAAVVLTPYQERVLSDLGLKDSKLLTPRKRESLFRAMAELGVAWAAQAASKKKIARLNIGRASLWAMGQSALKLVAEEPLDLLVVDGRFEIPDLPLAQLPLVAADRLVPAVSAASVVAKVLRDRVMMALDSLYPQYGFARHKGYPTKEHREAVLEFGISPVHRESFCRKLLQEPFLRDSP